MADLKNRFDINFGCAKDIAKTCGISLDTAHNIVRYRNSYGQYNTVEELLRVPGLSKVEYRSVAQIFNSMNRNRIPIVAPKVIHSRGGVGNYNASPATEGLMLQGLSLNNNSNEVRHRQHSAPARRLGYYDLRSYPSGTLRNGKRYRPQSQYQAPPMGARQATSHKQAFVNGYKFQNRYTKSASSKGTIEQVVSKSRQRSSEEIEHVEIVTPSHLTPKKNQKNPSAFTVQTSPCGNKINFSCTFDKNLLQEPTSMAFLFNQSKNKAVKSTESTQQAVYVCANDKGSSTEGSVLSQLSQENVIIFEKANTPTASDKRQRITQWVRKVNSDRSVYTSTTSNPTFRTAPRSLARSRDSSTILRRVLNQAPAHIDVIKPAAEASSATKDAITRAKTAPPSTTKKSTSKTNITFEEKNTTDERVSTTKRAPTPPKTRRKREHIKKPRKTTAEARRQRSTSGSVKNRRRSSSRSEKRPKSGRSARRRSLSRISSHSERRQYYKYYTKSVRKTDSDSYDGCSVM